MEQFRYIGGVLGSMKSLMVFRDNIQINQRQCCLLLDVFESTYDSVAQEMRHNLKFEEKHAKWGVLETPMRELCKVFKEAESYIKHCLEAKEFWASAIALYKNEDCVEFHIHNLLSCFPIVIEAIEMAAEDTDKTQKKRLLHNNKYSKEWLDPILFQWKFGRQYLVTQDFRSKLDSVRREDRWVLINKVQEKKMLTTSSKYENRLIDAFQKISDCSRPLDQKFLPSSILVGSKDYCVRRRLGSGSQYKEIQWLGENFALRHLIGDIEPFVHEISTLMPLSHPNVMSHHCAFSDEDKKECFLVMDLMNKSLNGYIKEVCSPKRRVPFSLPVAVDLILQIARGMEYLHSNKMYHGDLNPSNVLVKARGHGYLHAKVSGFGLSFKKNVNPNEVLSFIWHAPEVLEEQERLGNYGNCKYAEKADVYSFGMVCFELLTGKVPFEDSHLQGDKMSRNIRAGERPLFPFNSMKCVTNLTRKCWHSDPNQRPSFASICRILRYIKRLLVLNPEYCNEQWEGAMQVVDYCEIESGLVRKFSSWEGSELKGVWNIPFEMFGYRVGEKEKGIGNASDSGSERGSNCGDEEHSPSPIERRAAASPETIQMRLSPLRKSPDPRPAKQPGTPRSTRPPPLTVTPSRSPPRGIRNVRHNSESQLMTMSPKSKRTSSGHASDSELSSTSISIHQIM